MASQNSQNRKPGKKNKPSAAPPPVQDQASAAAAKSPSGKNLVTLGIAAATLLAAAFLLFSRLGHYSIWDDEAMIALAAKGVLQTGDTTMRPDDHNIVAYREGALLRDFKDRSTPPLSAYLTAGSFALLGQNAFAARLPFAIFGLATVGLLLFWTLRETQQRGAAFKGKNQGKKASFQEPPSWLPMALVGLAILGNVSLFLFSRQCRYYAPTIFFSLLVAYLYLNWKGGKAGLLVLAAASVLLFVSNYLNYLALYLCIALDYFMWRRKDRPLALKDWATLLAPQCVLCLLVVMVWNPMRTQFGGYVQQNTLGDKITLLFWQFRDLNRCEFVSGPLILAAMGLALTRKDKWLARGCCALALYVGIITLVSPQTVSATSVADIRYLVAIIPLGIALAARVLLLTVGPSPLWAVGLGALVFWTNLPNGGPVLWCKSRSTIVEYIRELANPPAEPYRMASEWINANLKQGESIWVFPDYMAYPLMFHAPKALYAWQLDAKKHDPQFAGLPPIHFKEQVPPDYVIVFGPASQQIRQALCTGRDARYKEVAMLDCYGKDLFRPELFWRTFTQIANYNRDTDGIYIFKSLSL